MFDHLHNPQPHYNHQSAKTSFGALPVWALEDLYPAPDAPEFQADMNTLSTMIEQFAKDYQGQLSHLPAREWSNLLERLETIKNLQGRIMSYAGLRYYQNTIDPERAKFLSDCQTALTEQSADLVFFELEFTGIDEDYYQNLFQENPALSRYRHSFDHMRAMRPYQLSDELEKFLHDQSVVGASAWNKLFDETMAAMEFEWDGEMMPLEAILNKTSDTNRATREKATRLLIEKFMANQTLFARITNTLAQEKAIEDRWRKFPEPMSARHLANDIEPEVVEALRQAVTDAYPRISHRYYALKAKWMGLEKLEVWDRNAPLDENSERIYTWQEARELVLEAYEEFDPRMKPLATPFFENGWIDAGVQKGKAPGAFAHPTVTNVHPYIMLNYMGKTRDVMTLAHELGHGVHQRLAAKQGEILADTPLTLAETASVFGEMLTFQKILSTIKDPKERKAVLAGKVEDMINTVIRQISFYDFEIRVHQARKQGELTAQNINDIWLAVSQESLGPAFNFVEGYESFWSYIPHFIHSPFYVYAYAFGDSLVNALYARYQEGAEGFADQYFALLEAGGSQHHSELLAPFGLDASDPKFWQKGLSMIESFIDELESLE